MSTRMNPIAARPGRLELVRELDVPASFDALVDAAQRAETQGQRGQARALYETALQRLPEARSGAQASDLLRWIARTHRADAEFELALDCAAVALAVAEAHADETAIGHAINLQAIIHWQQGALDEAERLFHLARSSALRAGEAKLSAMTAQNLGVIANVRGDEDTALRYLQAGLSAYRTLGLANDVCIALNNLGLLYAQRRQWNEAESSYDEALCIADVLGDHQACVRIDVNRAECLVAQGRYDEARSACERAEQRSRRIHDSDVMGELQKALGVVERETGDHERAEAWLTSARQIATERQDLLLLAETTKELAELHRQQGRNRDTLQNLNQSHRLFSQLRARRELADVGRRMGRLEDGFLEVVKRWGDSIESKDGYTQGHCERVAELACALAERAGLDQQSLFWFRIGALLHDVGKLVIPAEVLNKAGTLTPSEWELVKQHPSAGVEMLAEVDFPWDVRPLVESHHERWDGTGYPHGLRGEEIPFVARILCIADVYDALTSERSYKRTLSHADAMDIMRLESGLQFDPTLFSIFEDVAGRFARSSRRASASGSAFAPTGAFASVGDGTAATDELTELPLRRAFQVAAARALASRRDDESVAMLVIDVDRFKLVNDTYGHLAGDEVLRSVARVLNAHAPAGSTVARFAGDEFVMLLPGMAMREATAFAESLRVAMHGVPMDRGITGPVALTISVGVAAAPRHGLGVEALFGSADRALYEAKRAGRDAVVRADQPDLDTAPEPRFAEFAGRRDERRVLVDLLEQGTSGRPTVLTVVGEAGVGKTALLQELLPEARMRATSVVQSRCVDMAARPPYQAWRTLLESIHVLRLVPERAWRALPQLLGALPDRAAEAGTPSQFVLFEEVSEYLRMAARVRPLVLVLEDMHWADAASWNLFEYVVGRLERERLLLCVTLRREDLRGDVLERRRRLSRSECFRELALGRLSSEDMHEWLSAALQQAPDAEMHSFLARRSAGNAFILQQLVRAAFESGDLAWQEDGWTWRQPDETEMPTAVRDLLARRVELLSRSARRVLSAASLMGFELDIDRAVHAGLATEDEVLDAVDEGIAALVLDTASGGHGSRVSFAHPMLVDVLHEMARPRRLGRDRGARGQRRAEAVRDRPAPGLVISPDARRIS